MLLGVKGAVVVRPAGYRPAMEGRAVGVTIGLWRRHIGGRNETIRLVRMPGGEKFLVLRSGAEQAVFPNRALAEAAIAKVVGEAWVYAVPEQRHRPRHAPRTVA